LDVDDLRGVALPLPGSLCGEGASL
jgi:hypothetical protein